MSQPNSPTSTPTQPPGVVEPVPLPATLVRESHLIRPAHRRIRLPDLWHDIPVIRVMAARDFKARYKQSALGPLWIVLQPLALLAAFSVVFSGVSHVDTGDVPYPLFALVGLTVWSCVQLALTTGTPTFVTNMTLIRHVSCPRLVFPTASVIVALPVLALTLAVTLVAVALTGQATPRMVLLPLAIVWLLVLTWSITAILSALTVRMRDIMNFLPFALQAGLFFSPVAYPMTDASDWIANALALNPLTGLLDFWRWVLLDASPPLEVLPIAAGLIYLVVLAVAAWYAFARLEVTMADYV